MIEPAKKSLSAIDLALYLGCDVQTITRVAHGEGKPFTFLTGILVCADIMGLYDEYPSEMCEVRIKGEPDTRHYSPSDLKPILRKISDMTTDEAIERLSLQDKWLVTPAHMLYCVGESPASFRFLLQRGIDLFGWIDQGLAIDKATLNEQP